MDCKNCKDNRREPVPYIVHENAMARAERHVRRLWIALIVAVIALVGVVGGFLWYLSQYDFTGYSYEQDGDGVNIVGERNEVDYDVSKSENPQAYFEESLPSEGTGGSQG